MTSVTITPKDHQLLDLYSMYVRNLYLANFGEIIRGHVLHRLSNLTKPVLPNLQSIYIPNLGHVANYGGQITDIIFLALVKNITTLSISGIDEIQEEDIASYLSVLDEKKALLQDVHLGGFLTHDTLTLLNRFSNIQFLGLDLKGVYLDLTAIRTWSSLPFLIHLTIHLDLDSEFEVEGTATGNARHFDFPALQKLTFGGLPNEALKFLQSTGILKTLSCIALQIYSAPWETDFAFVQSATLSDCINECARIGPLLQHLDVRVEPADELQRQFLTLSEQSILTLSSGCRRLQRLYVTGCVHLAANDHTVHRVCANDGWKHLRLLHLPGGVDNTALSLLSLSTIAMNCPDLIDLKISVDFGRKSHQLLERELGGPRQPHGLQKFCLVKHKSRAPSFDSEVDINTTEMTIDVSRLIEYLFPYLNPDTIPLVGASLADQKWWKGVCSLMSAYQSVRKETLSQYRRSEAEAMEM